MATRPSRKGSRSVSIIANVVNTRYDLSMPQNWTVVELKAELQRNSIPFSPSAKKSRHIQLCKDNGQIDGRVAPLNTQTTVCWNLQKLWRNFRKQSRSI